MQVRRGLFLLFIILFCHSCGRAPPYDQGEVVLLSSSQSDRSQWTITLDPGHGGKDSGAESAQDRYEEKRTALATAVLVRRHLESLGYKVVMTRDRDIFIPLKERAMIANEVGSDLFVSIHYNAATNKEAQGVEVFCFGTDSVAEKAPEARKLAQSVLRGVLSKTGAKSRGVKRATFRVLRDTQMPAVLVEGGFLTNCEERAKLQDPKYVNQIAWGITLGIDDYLHSP